MRKLFLLVGCLALACKDAEPPKPCAGVLAPHEIHVGESTRVRPCFETSALPLTYETESTDPSILVATPEGETVRLEAVGIGEVVVTIIATDANGLSAEQGLLVTVPNRELVILDRPPLDMHLWAEFRIPLSEFVYDPDDQPLEYRIVVLDSAVHAQVMGDTLRLHGVKRGRARISFEVEDGYGDRVRLDAEGEVGPPIAYITQGSHSLRSDVPLIHGRPGLLRLFLATDTFGLAAPTVTGQLVANDGKVIRGVNPAMERATVPLEITEGFLASSYNGLISGTDIVPGSRLVLEIGLTSDPTLPRRIDMPLDVKDFPPLDLKLVPAIFNSDSSAIGSVDAIAADPRQSPSLRSIYQLLPVSEIDLQEQPSIHVAGSGDHLYRETLAALTMLWEASGRAGYYLAIIPRNIGDVAGAAYVAGPSVGFATNVSSTIAHELGHLFTLGHAPCRTFDPDFQFPYDRGASGVWGYDFIEEKLVSPIWADLMGYCHPYWMSDYHLKKATGHRAGALNDEHRNPQDVLVIWGWMDDEGSPSLLPSFYTTAPAGTPAGDSHTVTGWSGERLLFRYSFDPDELADMEGAAFAHMVPVTWGTQELTEIRLEGPGGTAGLDGESNRPLRIEMVDGRLGSVSLGAPGDSQQPTGGEVVFSRGLPRRR